MRLLRRSGLVTQHDGVDCMNETGDRGAEDLRTSPVWWRPVLAAAAAVIVLQGALLVGLWTRPDLITPLGGRADVVLQVTFAPEAAEARIREAIQGVRGTLVGGPDARGVYLVRLDVPPGDEARIDEAVDALSRRRDVVTHVARD